VVKTWKEERHRSFARPKKNNLKARTLLIQTQIFRSYVRELKLLYRHVTPIAIPYDVR